ncbi:MAG: hypothetical protein IPK69_00010 [Phycisphaerales bacterium]|nr:MAG: hypothetical protein IPK69_00010 [Phycisphaerales bacterium]
MRQFKDNAGRTWTVDINVATLKRVRGLTGVDLMQVIEGTLIEKFIRDPVLLCDVVYAVCKPEADAAKVSDEEFGKAMAGDAIEAATGAVLDELISFCPSPRDRANLGRVLQATNRVMEKARDVTEKRIETLTSEGELDKLVNRLLETSGSSSTSALELSASTPGP